MLRNLGSGINISLDILPSMHLGCMINNRERCATMHFDVEPREMLPFVERRRLSSFDGSRTMGRIRQSIASRKVKVLKFKVDAIISISHCICQLFIHQVSTSRYKNYILV